MVEAIQKEILLRKSEFENTQIQTIYFGGGTPSVLSAEEMERIFSVIHSHFNVSENSENTIEVNPDDFFINDNLKEDFLKKIKSIGFNRLSIGVQSFFDEDLNLVNRTHNSYQAKYLIEEAKKIFDNITIDLIYGIPYLSDEKWIKNIQTAIDFQIPHISAYALTVEHRTALEKKINSGEIPLVDEEQSQRQFYLLKDILEKEGFIHYELSNFGKQGYFSKNNTAYWSGKKYIGIGPSAHSYNGYERSWNISNNILYINNINKGVRKYSQEVLSLFEKYNEHILTGLRTKKGVSIGYIEEIFGENFKNHLLKQSSYFIDKGYLEIENNHLFSTRKGLFLLDGICSDLFWVD